LKSVLIAAVAALAMPAALHAQPAAPLEAATPPPPPAPRDAPYPAGPLRLEVDATDLDRRIFRVRETIPLAGPGPVTLLYPNWLPGNHAPRGELKLLGGLVIRAGGEALPWTRDPLDVFALRVTPPPGARALEVEFQFLSPTAPDQGRVVMTPEMLNAQWVALTLYPAGYYVRRITVEASIRLPAGWGYATALETAARQGDLVRFKPVAFDVLADSPLFAGVYHREFDLDPGGRSPVRLNLFADSPELLAATPDQVERHRELVRQADRLFGARHFDHYDFLLALSDRLGGIGLEHHRSSENGTNPDYFADWNAQAPERDLLPHEYSHSWDGKYRRPADLWTPDYNTPMRNSLLWVYEGQDQYWGYVLGARSGLLTRQQAMDALAMTAASFSIGRPGREWRSVEDTTNDPIITARRPIPWTSWQRNEDYYSEGQLVWLEVDATIREMSRGRRSLDDFARAFFGMHDGDYGELTYTFDDVVAALNAVQPNDWASLLRERVDMVRPAPPFEGLSRSG